MDAVFAEVGDVAVVDVQSADAVAVGVGDFEARGGSPERFGERVEFDQFGIAFFGAVLNAVVAEGDGDVRFSAGVELHSDMFVVAGAGSDAVAQHFVEGFARHFARFAFEPVPLDLSERLDRDVDVFGFIHVVAERDSVHFPAALVVDAPQPHRVRRAAFDGDGVPVDRGAQVFVVSEPFALVFAVDIVDLGEVDVEELVVSVGCVVGEDARLLPVHTGYRVDEHFGADEAVDHHLIGGAGDGDSCDVFDLRFGNLLQLLGASYAFQRFSEPVSDGGFPHFFDLVSRQAQERPYAPPESVQEGRVDGPFDVRLPFVQVGVGHFVVVADQVGVFDVGEEAPALFALYVGLFGGDLEGVDDHFEDAGVAGVSHLQDDIFSAVPAQDSVFSDSVEDGGDGGDEGGADDDRPERLVLRRLEQFSDRPAPVERGGCVLGERAARRADQRGRGGGLQNAVPERSSVALHHQFSSNSPPHLRHAR